VKQGWHVALAYVAGFAAMMLVVGWLPEPAVNKAAAPIALMKAQNAGNVEARK
jgi:hypothetical protein